MESFKKHVSVVLFLLCFAGFSQAQTLGGGFAVVLPQGEFADQNDNTGFGLQIQATYPSPGKVNPFAVGIDFGYYIFQTTDENRPFSLTIPDVTVNVQRSHNMMNFHLFLMVSPLEGDVRPYVEAIGGGSYLFTETQVKSRNTDDEFASDTNFDDFAWSYGAGGGILIRVARALGDVNELFVDLKVRYLKGTEAEFLTKDDIEINPNTRKVYYYPRKSLTDILSLQIGVQAFF